MAYLCPVECFDEIVDSIKFKNTLEITDNADIRVRDDWVSYIKEGNDICKPSDYIILNKVYKNIISLKL